MTDPYQLDRPIICPYDSNHSIAASRIQKHLVKCARNFPPDYKVSCPYNATHRLFKSEVQGHISNCPDHQHVDPTIYEMHRKQGKTMSSVSLDGQSTIDCQESWDEEEIDLYPISNPSEFQYRQESTILDPVGRLRTDQSGSSSVVPKIPLVRANIRPPSGYAEALMIEQSGESTIEDMESVASFMGVGRGRPWNEPRKEILMKVGRGRGSAQANVEF